MCKARGYLPVADADVVFVVQSFGLGSTQPRACT